MQLKFIGPHRLLINIALVMGVFVSPALADWWIVRSADGVCLVVDIRPTGKDPSVTKVGKDSYRTEAEANADLKRLCEEPKAPTKPNRPR
jgi:hypothetical protein